MVTRLWISHLRRMDAARSTDSLRRFAAVDDACGALGYRMPESDVAIGSVRRLVDLAREYALSQRQGEPIRIEERLPKLDA